ncbi:MAG: DUF3419 family protein [Verrucomicrobiota bacterium]
MSSEVASKADFSRIRYAQCWEDADVLLEGLDIQPGDIGLSIASAGDNALAMLSRGPARVLAVDLNPAQLACVELRVAAYKNLAHAELLELIGSRPSRRRSELFQRCRNALSTEVIQFWEHHSATIDAGIGSGGKFENYFRLFRQRALRLVHSPERIAALLEPRDAKDRAPFYEQTWNTWRWRTLFRLFFSRTMMGRLGRDPSFFTYVEGSVADRILKRARHALVELEPAKNPYLHWILTGTHGEALPFALREENFDAIRENIDRLEWRLGSIEDAIGELGPDSVARFNLSDIFEYMSEENFHKLLEKLTHAATPGARLAYWNMLAPRCRPEIMADRLRPLEELSRTLHLKDKAFFYSRFVVEEVL